MIKKLLEQLELKKKAIGFIGAVLLAGFAGAAGMSVIEIKAILCEPVAVEVFEEK